MNQPPKPEKEIVGGFAIPIPGTVLAVFSDDDGGEFTDPVLALFVRSRYSDRYGNIHVLDGFLAGGGPDLCPVSDAANFVGFRVVQPAEAQKSEGAAGEEAARLLVEAPHG